LTLAREAEKLCGRKFERLATGRTLPDCPAAEMPHHRTNFLYAGRLEPVKGVDLLLNALAQLRAQKLPAHLYVAGSGSEEPKLRAQARALSLDESVTFLGVLADRPLASYLRAVDAVVIPSRAEALPVIFTEAARFGTPAVTTDVGDLGILARQYGTAIVVEPERVDALARGMIAMARADRAALQKGMPALLENFDCGRAAETLLNQLEQSLRK
jgi:glycosyltransferase involved in cell wall biosynthesis